MHKTIEQNALFNPIVFVQKMYHLTWVRYNWYKTIYIFLNVVMMTSSTISIIWFAVVFYKYGHYTTSFLLMNAAFSAITNLLSALLNLFFIKKRKNKYHERHWKISSEIVHYRAKTDVYTNEHEHPREHQLFLKVAKIIGVTKVWRRDYYEND